jgi:hypothetical protein
LIEASGSGRPYSIKHVEAWWRDLAELPYFDEARAAAFVRRRGDPLGTLEQGKPTGTGAWLPLIANLRVAAGAWEALGDDGLSRFKNDGREVARIFAEGLPERWEDDLGVTYRRGLEPVVVAQSLPAYLIASALGSLQQRRPMKRCAYCHSWFTLNHGRAEFCSQPCRGAFSNGKVSPYGLNSQADDESGLDPLEREVAGTWTGRDARQPGAELRHPKGSEGVRGSDAPRARATRRRRSE